ncbi:uncharacterized protein LOC126675483 [Mercurialis annua]|uniref:uncharacterized protein LOC126675483 n=1 Tax=Mercurialis annua TaxID=3986 RepID=UPI00215FB0B2|nr:uncharacterized protein LOC126675483 [Mercurialis annua]
MENTLKDTSLGSPSDDPPTDDEKCSTKKVKNRPEEIMRTGNEEADMEVETTAKTTDVEEGNIPKASFKEKLMSNDKALDSDPEDDHSAFVLSNDDIEIGNAKGVPSINFSDRIHNLFALNMKLCVVVRLLGKTIGYRTLFGRLMKLWKPKNYPSLVDLDNNFFLVRFYSMDDYINALSGGPWVLFGHYLTVQPWDPSFSSDNTNTTSVTAWVRFPGLPYHYYHNHVLKAIASTIGSVVRIDYNTEARERGKFARLAISLDLTKPLVSRILIDGRIQKVEYEGLPIICFDCGRYGHRENYCPFKTVDTSMDDLAKSNSSVLNQPPATVVEDAQFGPWMQVANRRRKPDFQANNHGNNGQKISGSIFDSLANLVEDIQETNAQNGKAEMAIPNSETNMSGPQIRKIADHATRSSSGKGKNKAHVGKENIPKISNLMAMQIHASDVTQDHNNPMQKHAEAKQTNRLSNMHQNNILTKLDNSMAKVSITLDPTKHSAVSIISSDNNNEDSIQLSQLKNLTLRDKFNQKGPDKSHSQWSVKINKHSKSNTKIRKKKEVPHLQCSSARDMILEMGNAVMKGDGSNNLLDDLSIKDLVATSTSVEDLNRPS